MPLLAEKGACAFFGRLQRAAPGRPLFSSQVQSACPLPRLSDRGYKRPGLRARPQARATKQVAQASTSTNISTPTITEIRLVTKPAVRIPSS